MSTPELTPYREIANVLAALPLLLREERRRRQLSIRATARELGCAFATVSRIEDGEDCVLSNAVAVLRWLDGQPAATTELERTRALVKAARAWRAQFEKPADTKLPRMRALLDAVDALEGVEP